MVKEIVPRVGLHLIYTPNFQLLPSVQVEGRDPSGAGVYIQEDIQGWPARHWLEAIREALMQSDR